MTKIAGSGSGSISPRHCSADPDPHLIVLDLQHRSKVSCLLASEAKNSRGTVISLTDSIVQGEFTRQRGVRDTTC
jgi:hypothetical protein